MIFYLATETTGRKVLCGTQADAKKLDKNFEQVDIPVDKKGLQEFVQESLDALFEMGKDKPSPAAAAAMEVLANPLEPKLIITGEPAGGFGDRFDNARDDDRAALMGCNRDVLALTDKIMALSGWPLGQAAMAVTSRISELSKPYVETLEAQELEQEIEDAAQTDEELLEIADDKHRAQVDDGDD